jgi:NAD(P)-dependent dehydrogenase (short-subunit alcohol dehydrogenase family)
MTDSTLNANAQDRLEGTIALVTGGTDGIGLHTASGLAALGAGVIVTGRDEGRGADAAAQIRARTGCEQVSFIQVDHLTVGANQLLAEQLRNSLDRLDILVNNVGRVFATRQETADGYEATLALCFAGPVALTEAVLPLLDQSRDARVVNMNSSAYKMWHHDPFDDVQSRRSYVGIQTHAHAKLLNLIWTFALAERLKEHGVSVNATNPGAAWTPGTAQLTPEAVPAWRYIWPVVRFFQRRGSPAKAALTALWLAASGEAGAITGTYVEKRKRQRPGVATHPDNQRRVTELAKALVSQAPTATPPFKTTPNRGKPADRTGRRNAHGRTDWPWQP